MEIYWQGLYYKQVGFVHSKQIPEWQCSLIVTATGCETKEEEKLFSDATALSTTTEIYSSFAELSNPFSWLLQADCGGITNKQQGNLAEQQARCAYSAREALSVWLGIW